MPKSTVCTHPELLAIDQAILSGDFTLAALSQKFGPSSSALQRHKGHLRDKMQESRRRLQEIREQGSLLLLNAFLDHVKKGVEAAEADSNLTGVFRGSYIGSRIIYQLNRMEGSMSLDTLHRLLTSPAWVPQGSLLPTDPKLITDLHQALVDGAFGPCPESVPLISDNDTEEDEYSNECEENEDTADDAEKSGDHDAAYPLPDNLKLSSAFSETENGKRQTENDLLIRQLQDLLPDLDLTLADLHAPNRKFTEKLPKNHRKISEKSRQTPRAALIKANNIINIRQAKKNYRKIPV